MVLDRNRMLIQSVRKYSNSLDQRTEEKKLAKVWHGGAHDDDTKPGTFDARAEYPKTS